MTDATPLVGHAGNLGTPQRQSLWAVVFLALRTLRSVGLVQLALFVGFVIARLPSVLAFAGLVAVIGVVLFAVAGLQWWRFTFQVEGEELVVQRGVVQQQRMSIPLRRVQSVSLEQKLLHRIVSLVQISLETAGTESAEFVIDAVDQGTARELQQMIANYRSPRNGPHDAVEVSGDSWPASSQTFEAGPPPPERIVVRHDLRRVVQIALSQTPFAGLVVLAPLLAMGDEVRQVLPFDLPNLDEPQGPGFLVWLLPLALMVGLLTSLILNLVRVLLTDWNLTVRSTSVGLRRDAGLLSTTSVATPVPRIQMVHTRQGPLERPWGLHTVQLATIGSTNILVPGCSHEQADELVDLALAGETPAETLTERVSSAEVFFRTRTALVLALIAVAGLAMFVGWWSLLPPLRVPYVWARTRRQVRLRRWTVGTDMIGQYRELLAWQREDLLVRKINGVTVSQRLFERKRGLATVTFSTAAGNLSIGMIPVEKAQCVRDSVLRSVETDHRSWM